MIVKCGREPSMVEFIFLIGSMVFRPLWSFVLSIVFWVYSLSLFLLSKAARTTYIFGREAYNRVSSLIELVNWAKVSYRYVYDDFGDGFLGKEKLRGWLDHDGTRFEFFTRGGGDCEDVAEMVKCKLIQLGYDAVRVNMIGSNDIKTGHFDCLFYDKGIHNYCLFNYGTIRYGDSVQAVFKELGRWWVKYEDAYYFKWWF